jgi:hypothetical protein
MRNETGDLKSENTERADLPDINGILGLEFDD